jgi:hypothetical protein
MTRICGIYPTAGGMYPRPRKILVELETVVLPHLTPSRLFVGVLVWGLLICILARQL